MDEDWDAEIAGTSEPKFKQQEAYTAPGYDTNRNRSTFQARNTYNDSESRGRGGFDRSPSFGQTADTYGASISGFGRGRGGSSPRGRRGGMSESQNWRASTQGAEQSESRTFTRHGEETSLSVDSQFVGRIIGKYIDLSIQIPNQWIKNIYNI